MTGLRFGVMLLAMFAFTGMAKAEAIGTMTPAQPITQARIAALSGNERAAWRTYLRRSKAQLAADKAALAAERQGMSAVPSAPSAGTPRSMPLGHPTAWYASDEAQRIAENIVSFQTPAGGWGKNQDRTAPPRVRGQGYVVGQDPQIAKLPGAAQVPWSYVGTIDNDATHTELRFLARVQAARTGLESERYRRSFLKGVRYLLNAQFPNGGWPQVYPLQGGYHDAITYNDGALAEVATLLAEIGTRRGDFVFVPAEMARDAAQAAVQAAGLILRTQVVVDGKRTIWGQQHDALTLAPVGARNFEPAALSSDESVGLIRFLLNHAPHSKAAIADAVNWLEHHALRDLAWKAGREGRSLAREMGAGPLWARFYAIDTGRPIFGDRDRSIHDDVNQLSRERRDGYNWFTRRPCKVVPTCR